MGTKRGKQNQCVGMSYVIAPAVCTLETYLSKTHLRLAMNCWEGQPIDRVVPGVYEKNLSAISRCL